jgi:hypothetical protein
MNVGVIFRWMLVSGAWFLVTDNNLLVKVCWL